MHLTNDIAHLGNSLLMSKNQGQNMHH